MGNIRVKKVIAMVFKVDENASFTKVVAEKNGYILNERHVVVYLYSNQLAMDKSDCEMRVNEVVTRLITEFNSSPAYTVIKLEQYAKYNFHKVSSFLKERVGEDRNHLNG